MLPGLPVSLGTKSNVEHCRRHINDRYALFLSRNRGCVRTENTRANKVARSLGCNDLVLLPQVLDLVVPQPMVRFVVVQREDRLSRPSPPSMLMMVVTGTMIVKVPIG